MCHAHTVHYFLPVWIPGLRDEEKVTWWPFPSQTGAEGTPAAPEAAAGAGKGCGPGAPRPLARARASVAWRPEGRRQEYFHNHDRRQRPTGG